MDDYTVIHTYLETHAEPCFNLLYYRYSQKIFRRCISLLKNETEAEDAMQEILIKLHTKLEKFKGKSSFSTWVYSVTYNHCMDILRKKRYVMEPDENLTDPGEDPEEIPDEEILAWKNMILKKVLDDIRPEDSAILLMKYLDQLSIKDIGFVLEKSDSAVKMQIKRAKERAVARKKELEREYQLEAY